jgi:hypothetical protein
LWRALWSVPAISLVFAAAQLAQAHYPTGHDASVHVNTTVALAYILQHAPGDAWVFLRTNLIHWPPLVPLLTAPLLWAGAGVWAFHAVTLLFDAIFVIFLGLLLRRLTGDAETSLLGLLVVLACPHWPAAATAFNLEAPVAAATVFVAWAVVSERAERGWTGAAVLGAACGALLLTKTVILPIAMLPLIWAGGRAWARRRAGWRTWAKPALFLALALTPAAVWFLPAATRAWTVMTSDVYGLRSVLPRPWWWYAQQFVTGYGGLPMLLGFLFVAPSIRWRSTPPAVAPIALGAAVSFAFFSSIATKRAFYPLPSYVLLMAALTAAMARAEHRLAGLLRRALLAVFAAAAMLIWLPKTGAAVALLSLGTAAPHEGERRDDFRVQAEIASELERLAAGREMGLASCLNLTGLVPLNHVETILALDRPPFALVNGLFLPLKDTLRRLPRSSFLLMVEKRQGPYFTLDSLMVQGPGGLTRAGALDLRETLDRQRRRWREVSRLHFPGFTVGFYENATNLRLLPPAATPEIYLDYLSVDDLPRLLAACRRNLRAGNYRAALHQYRLAHQFHPEAPEGYLGLIETLPHVVGPADEAAELAALAQETPLPPPVYQGIIQRLRQLEAAGEPTAQFAASAERLLARLDANDPGRSGVVGQLFDYLAETHADAAALALADREAGPLPPDRRVEQLWDLAESARARGRGELAAQLYQRALRESDLPRTRSLAQLRLAALQPDGASWPDLDNVADAAQAREATRLLFGLSGALRSERKFAEALALASASRTWLSLCPVCGEELRLEQARTLLQGGAYEEAERLLRTIRLDPDLRRIAQDLLAAPRRR